MDNLLLIFLLIINIYSLFIMYIDKRRAIKNKWRIKESTLFFLSILGGSLGILIGMYIFHHKTKHIKFIIGIPLILLIQIFLIFLFLNL